MRARRSSLFLIALLFSLVSGQLGLSGCAALMAGSCENGDEEACRAACSVSLSCPAAAPICDETFAVCRACSPGEDRRCRERGDGAQHCVAGRCVACIAPRGVPAEVAGCDSESPICDEHSCRACTRHSECQSGVCAKDDSGAASGIKKGSCVPAEQVLVVDQDLCSRSGPVYCTPQQAFLHVNKTQRYVLLRRGATPDDFSSLTFGDLPSQTMQQVRVIGPLADNPPHRAPGLPLLSIGNLTGKNGLIISHGRIILEGLFVRDARIGIGCTGSDAEVQIERSFLSGNGTAIAASGGCKLRISDTWIGSGPVGTGFVGLPGNVRGIEVNGAELHIENSLFVDDGDFRQDALGGIYVKGLAGSVPSTIVNTTFFQQNGVLKGGRYVTTLLCDAPVGERLVVLNSLLLSDLRLAESPEERYFDPVCGARIEHLASNDSALTANGSALLPTDASLFVDAKGRDLRPVDGSDAGRQAIKNGGVRSITVSGQLIKAPATDLDGQVRPVSGEVLSVGAFEPVAAPAP